MTMQALNLGRLTIETETLETLNLLAQWQSTSRAQVIQRLLRDGAKQAKIEHAAGLYGRGELIFGTGRPHGRSEHLRHDGPCARPRHSAARGFGRVTERCGQHVGAART